MDMHEFGGVAATIEKRSEAVTVFFRDDDVGWANDSLRKLCNRFETLGVPLDLAVIPGVLDRYTALAVKEVVHTSGANLGLHQHGYMHLDHQASGRKCEFGDARSEDEKFDDIRLGQAQLRRVFGDLIDPVFTPPWNRCGADTCAALKKLDFKALSRIVGSDEIDHCGLVDVSVSIDWQKKRGGERIDGHSFDAYAAMPFVQQETVGIMLHHEHLDGSELDRMSRFVGMLQNTGQVHFKPMRDVANCLVTIGGNS